MAKFLNKKEQVYDMQLTQYGKHLLSVGSFKPTYYAFYDSNIIYDKRYTSGSNPYRSDIPVESQNHIDPRIKKDTVYLEPLVMFTSPEYTEEILYEDNQYLTDISPTRMQPAPDVFKYVNAIGDAWLQAEKTDLAPAWKLVCLEGEISAIDTIDIINETKVPQIDVVVRYVKTVVDSPYNVDPKNAMDMIGIVGPFSDENYIRVMAQDFLIYADEVNTQLLTENFDIEIFEVSDNTGVKASGQIDINASPAAGYTIRISDGFRAVVFEWVIPDGTPSSGEVAVVLDSSPESEAKNLATAINNSVLNIEAQYVENTISPCSVVLTNGRIGVGGNVAITGDPLWDTTITGMQGGQDGSDVLNRKYFSTRIPQVVDGFMQRSSPDSEFVSTAMISPTTTGSVSYYFDDYRDNENSMDKLCKAVEYYNKETYYINVELDCKIEDSESIYYDIYGSAMEPEICQD